MKNYKAQYLHMFRLKFNLIGTITVPGIRHSDQVTGPEGQKHTN